MILKVNQKENLLCLVIEEVLFNILLWVKDKVKYLINNAVFTKTKAKIKYLLINKNQSAVFLRTN